MKIESKAMGDGTRRRVTVLGAGIVGLGCALWLQRDGHEVTIVDRDEPGGGCSRGNAGLIQCASVVPGASPSTLRAVPKMLLEPDHALVIRWRHLHTLAPWLARFLNESRPTRVAANASALASLVPRAWDGWLPLLSDHGLSGMAVHSGELHVYESEAGFAAAAASHALRRRHGVEAQVLSDGELHELEPALSPHIRHAVMLPDAWLTSDPFELSRALARAFVNAGGRIVQASIRHIEPHADGGAELVTDDGRRLPAPSLVMALGAHSGAFCRALGVRVALDTERGYHVTLPEPGVSLGRSLIAGDWRFAMSPLSTGLRLAGTAELASVDAPANVDRARRLVPLARRFLPGLRDDRASTWMGHRPSTPDSKPVIGPAPGRQGIWLAFGHGYSGLTLGGITGRLIADLVAERTPSIDLAPFRADRFGLH